MLDIESLVKTVAIVRSIGNALGTLGYVGVHHLYI